MAEKRLKVAVLLSGSGRTLENLLLCRQRDALPVDIPVVISSRSNVRGLEIARQANIVTHVVTRRQAPSAAELSKHVLAATEPHSVDLLLLAGYLLKLKIIPRWRNRILNIHPSLLPLFGGQGMYGRHVHEAVLASGMKVSGCTVHLVTEAYDSGPIILQRCVPVMEDDTPDSLGDRVFDLECELYPQALRLFTENRIEIQGNRVHLHVSG